MNNRFLVFTTFLIMWLLMVLGGSYVEAQPATAGSQRDWEKTLKAAEREGQVAVYTATRGGALRMDAFKKKYPKIKFVTVSITPAQVAQRVLAERRARKYLVDVVNTGANPNYQLFYPAKMLDPIKSALILPEVLDKSKWYRGQHFYIDEESKYVFVYYGNVSRVASYNTKLVNPAEFKSYWDFLKPEWKGKIVARDIRRPGSGGDAMRFFYHNPDIGPKFIRRLFSEMDITLVRSGRQGLDWLARGKYTIGMFIGRVAEAKAQGLSVDEFDPHALKEGAPLGIGSGSLALMKNAPHPNAARVFINWFLSREGQIAVQEEQARDNSGADSMRIDVPKDVVLSVYRRREGAKYLFVGTPERTNMQPIYKVVKEALATAAKRK